MGSPVLVVEWSKANLNVCSLPTYQAMFEDFPFFNKSMSLIKLPVLNQVFNSILMRAWPQKLHICDSGSIFISFSPAHESELIPSLNGFELQLVCVNVVVFRVNVSHSLSIPYDGKITRIQGFAFPCGVLEFESESTGQFPVVVLSKGDAEAQDEENAQECQKLHKKCI